MTIYTPNPQTVSTVWSITASLYSLLLAEKSTYADYAGANSTTDPMAENSTVGDYADAKSTTDPMAESST